MTSSSSSSGACAITVYFAIGTDPDMAQVQVQNRVNIAQPNFAGKRYHQRFDG